MTERTLHHQQRFHREEWWRTPPFVFHIRSRRIAREVAREIVLKHGWWTLQWPTVRKNFSPAVRRAVNLVVAYAVIVGGIKGLR